MVAINGGLTQEYGVYTAAVIIHVVGLILIVAVVAIKRERFFPQMHPWFLYLGGALGVFTTVSNNFAFGRISVSAILALGLFGQSLAGIAVDQWGLFGMQRHRFTKEKLIGLLLILVGIGSMITTFEVVAVVVSFAAGVNIVITRSLNAKLADLTSVRVGTFYNYLIGLLVAIPVFFILGTQETAFVAFSELSFSPSWYIYLGGVLGVCVVLLSNITAVKISAFYLVLLIFVGQVFTGVLIDAVIDRELSARILVGGILVAIGLIVNLILDNRRIQNASHDS